MVPHTFKSFPLPVLDPDVKIGLFFLSPLLLNQPIALRSKSRMCAIQGLGCLVFGRTLVGLPCAALQGPLTCCMVWFPVCVLQGGAFAQPEAHIRVAVQACNFSP